MSNNYLYSVVLELVALNEATLPATMGHQAHALFLDLVRQADPALAARLHDEPGYRPFTVSPLQGGRVQGGQLHLQAAQPCRLRLTLLDGGYLWQCLSRHFLNVGRSVLHLGQAKFELNRVLSTPSADPTGWASFVDWQTLANTSPVPTVRLRFVTPTAFNVGDKQFTLFPEPALVWDSFLRVWNLYAPPACKIEEADKESLREFVKSQVVVSDYELQTVTQHFPSFVQKGFVGVCTYKIKLDKNGKFSPDLGLTSQIAGLTQFARYAGVGYKTTMGMGQVRCEG